MVRLFEDRVLAENLSLQKACQVVTPRLGVSWHTARQWVQRSRCEGRVHRLEEDVIVENARLRRENQQLRDTNELLKAASAFFASELGPQRRKWSLSLTGTGIVFRPVFICATLNAHREGGFIASRGYRQSKSRGVSARALRDVVVIERVKQIHRDNYSVYGIRKMWHALRREGTSIGREQTARLMRLAGLRGKMKGKCPITTRKASREDTRPDLVKRDFRAPAPNRLWVADITYVRTVKGIVYAAFVTDVFSPKIVGWALSDSMRTKSLPLQALNQAVVSAKETAGLVHHSDHESQYVSIVYNDTLTNAGIRPSTGTIGDSYDNALAENVKGSYKNELIHTRQWNDVIEVEIAIFQWVSWWNEHCLHQALSYRATQEIETEYWEKHKHQAIIENKANA